MFMPVNFLPLVNYLRLKNPVLAYTCGMKKLIFAAFFVASSAHAEVDFFQCLSTELTPEIYIAINGEQTAELSTGPTLVRAVRPAIGRSTLLAAWGIGTANSNEISLDLMRSTGTVGSIKAVTTGEEHYLTGSLQAEWLNNGDSFAIKCTHFN